jgi:hypothetical protein
MCDDVTSSGPPTAETPIPQSDASASRVIAPADVPQDFAGPEAMSEWLWSVRTGYGDEPQHHHPATPTRSAQVKERLL